MNNPNSGTPQQPGGYEALQAAQEIITSDAKRPANSIVFPFRQTKGRL